MFRAICVIAVVALCVLSFTTPVQAQVLSVACEGTESSGGGNTHYQYTLINTSENPVTLTLFYVGTMQTLAGGYSNWQTPPGFTATVGTYAVLGPQFSVMPTTLVKTPHGVVPPPAPYATPGAVVWSGSQVIAPQGTITFGFDHTHHSVDVEWFAEHPDAVNSSQGYPGNPMAGPLGVYTNGYVHGPGTEPVATEPSTWGKIKALYR